ncbi:ADP-ribosylation factor-like protein 2-binding protein [Diachasma alloeum]|uniref:ADP-ribosylation factor-like protein 2-binding protein n=1 Tax=Diachasma alloeum TaxID=454923 RepID=UPI0007381913|nr:ADP-ribosylation factor-like protein 2-binding protein [Diachasma alloeum]
MATKEGENEEKGETFDVIIGHIEDILMEPKFQETQQYFLEKYWREFDSVEENKLIYMDIFDEYHKAIESYIEESLKRTIPGFSMESLVKQLSDRSPELDGEVFEVLETFTDFLAFKEMILDYRAMKEGKVQDLSSGISITPMRFSDSDDNEG